MDKDVNREIVKAGQITNPDRLFNNLALEISDKYKEVGVELGLQYKLLYDELETGLYMMLTTSKKAMKMLRLWQQSISEDQFTYSVLAAALEKCGLHRAARKFCYTEATSKSLFSKSQERVETHGAPTLDSK